MTFPRAASINALRDALAAHHIHATITPLGTDGIKIKPENGTLWPVLEAFISGFKAGFNSP